MLDLFCIFHRGGTVLFKTELSPVANQPLNHLISDVLFEERTSDANNLYTFDTKYSIRWLLHNQLDIVFAVVHLNMMNPQWLNDFLNEIRDVFVAQYAENVKTLDSNIQDKFIKQYHSILNKYESKAHDALKKPVHSHGKKKKDDAGDDATPIKGKKKTVTSKDKDNDDDNQGDEIPPDTTDDASSPAVSPSSTPSSTVSSPTPSSPSGGNFDFEKLVALQKMKAAGPGPRKPKAPATKTKAAAESPNPPPKGKVMRQSEKVSKAEAAALDYSKKNAANTQEETDADTAQSLYNTGDLQFSDDEDSGPDEPDDDDEEESGDASAAAAATNNNKSKGFFGFFKGLVGAKVLEKADVAPALDQFRQALIGKNVAADIAEKLCDSVCATLEGKKIGSFTTIKSTVKTAIEEALTRILTPKRQIDVLHGIQAAKEQKRPYSIVFVGVNGVGKSTSLAKTAAYFLSKNLTVGVAACDTFRAGAIEQLRTHTKALGIPLYAKGYDRDAAAVAADAIAQAKRDGIDVILVDTAGRMQHNEPLMRALAKLMNVNKPDLVLFVGEALVGNDAVDQASEFNRCLCDMSDESKPRLIDGIILTKFDTIDDKVGAAISMAYTTGQPILFVGTGQTYRDLKRMNAKTLIKALLR